MSGYSFDQRAIKWYDSLTIVFTHHQTNNSPHPIVVIPIGKAIPDPGLKTPRDPRSDLNLAVITADIGE